MKETTQNILKNVLASVGVIFIFWLLAEESWPNWKLGSYFTGCAIGFVITSGAIVKNLGRVPMTLYYLTLIMIFALIALFILSTIEKMSSPDWLSGYQAITQLQFPSIILLIILAFCLVIEGKPKKVVS